MRTQRLNRFVAAVLATALLVAGLGACVQSPTEKTSIVDQRPQITFRVADNASGATHARVAVDGLDMGRVRDYLDGRASLRVTPGTHVIKVSDGETVFLNEQAYLGDGVVRPFNLTEESR